MSLTDTHVAFEAANPDLTGATVCHNGETFDVVAALKLGGGVLVVPTTDPVLVELLRALPALREVDVPEPSVDDVPDLAADTVPVLRDKAREAGIDGAAQMTKPELIAALTAASTDSDDAADPRS